MTPLQKSIKLTYKEIVYGHSCCASTDKPGAATTKEAQAVDVQALMRSQDKVGKKVATLYC